jgi:hypothetical protein
MLENIIYHLHPFGKFALIIYSYILYEIVIKIRTKQLFKETFRKAVQQSVITGYSLIIFGEFPKNYNSTVQRIITDEETAIQFFKEETEKIEAGVPTTTFVIFECNFFAHIKDFKVVENYLKNNMPENLYMCAKPIYSIFAYIDFYNLFKGDKKGPEKLFIFYPPWNNFVYMIDNPFTNYNRFICWTICGIFTSWFILFAID